MHRYRAAKLLIVVMSFFVIAVNLSTAGASSSNISHSYSSEGNIHNGSLVSLDSAKPGFVQAADVNNGSQLIGVTVSSQDSLLAVDPTGNTIQVALSGTVNTLVSTVNGNIKVGDQISVSPFAGIGMEASPASRVIGLAQTAFNQGTSGATAEQIKDKNGQIHHLEIGYVRLTIGIGTGYGTGAGGAQANFLQRLIKSLTGHTVSTIRIILSVIVGLVSLVSLITLVYASIYGSIVSVGRNPMAKNAIFRTLSSVMIMAFITVIVACITIYYLLK